MQSNWIAAFIIIGFLVYITGKGELAQYKAVILGGSQTPSGNTASSGGTSATPSQPSTKIYPSQVPGAVPD